MVIPSSTLNSRPSLTIESLRALLKEHFFPDSSEILVEELASYDDVCFRITSDSETFFFKCSTLHSEERMRLHEALAKAVRETTGVLTPESMVGSNMEYNVYN